MPRENKKRGRRAEAQKRKADVPESDDAEQAPKKRRMSVDAEPAVPTESLEEVEGQQQGYTGPEVEFYGLLDEEEQEYFRRADGLLEADDFPDAEQRTLFLENVHREAVGKELKLACSQSCSRLLERLMVVSTPTQLRSIFQKLNGHFLNLVQHRFASHVCETLFTKCAPLVTAESAEYMEQATDDGQIYVSTENLFLYAINELEPSLGYLLTDPFASHTLRVLLVILAGLPADAAGPTLLKSKAKEGVEVAGHASRPEEHPAQRQVPSSFTDALRRLLAESVAGLDTTALRSLALHPTGNPTLQLLLQLELTQFGKQKAKETNSVLHKLLPDEKIVEGSDSAAFVNGLLYDARGSRLLETVITYAPGKLFKSIYGQFFKERIGSLARNEIASYVVCKMLERLGGDDIKAAVQSIVPLVPNLAERGRTNVIKTLVERCAVRRVDTAPIAAAVASAYADDASGQFSLPKLLQLPPADSGLPTPASSQPQQQQQQQQQQETPLQRHASVLAQAFLAHPGPTADLIYGELFTIPTESCLLLARSPTFSHILQQAFTNAEAPVISRRKLITRFQSHIASLAVHPSGSHLVDAIWAGTQGLAFLRQRVAEELAEAEKQIRDSPSGRKVWRNWKMDLYQRRRDEWKRQTRDEVGHECFVDFPKSTPAATRGQNGHANGHGAGSAGQKAATRAHGATSSEQRGKSRLQLARERYAEKKAALARGPAPLASSSGTAATAAAMSGVRKPTAEV